MAQKKARGRRPGQQIDVVIDGTRVVLSLWMYRGTWVAETTLKGGRYYQAIGRSDLEVVQRIEKAIREREGRYRNQEAGERPGGAVRRGPEHRGPSGPRGHGPRPPDRQPPVEGAPDSHSGPAVPPPPATPD